MKGTTPRSTFTPSRPGRHLGFKHRLNQLALAASALLLCAPAWAQGLEPQPIGTYARLLQVLKEHQAQYEASVSSAYQTSPGGAIGLTTAAAGAVAADYSQTLVQVSGVDEADQVKNDGTHLYQLNQNRVLIMRAQPAASLDLVKVLDLSERNFSACGLFLDSRFLVVVGTNVRTPVAQPLWRRWARWVPLPQNHTVEAKVYDITHPAHPVKVREVEVDGDYVGARKVGSMLYLVSRHYPLCYEVNFQTSFARQLATPGFRDSRRSPGFRALGPQFCYYLPGFYDPNYLVVAGVDLAHASSGLDMNAYLGAGEQLYASTNNLYVTASRYPVRWPIWNPIITPILITNASPSGGFVFTSGTSVPQPSVVFNPLNDETEIYKFSLAAGKPRFVAAATIAGTVLNSYSMDEKDGYLRVATTSGGWWNGRTNQLYVLDSNLNLTGKLENLAPGERIYSARFLGNRAFLVTFQQIDPLFAIDLSDPAQPVVAGQLTLPGFSNFLLPYDENHLIGLGKETAPDSAYQLGMKLALFDVSDLANPTLVSSVSIGDRGTDSPALQDPHALLFEPTRNLLAFPITLAVATNSTWPWEYGQTVFQGAYVFQVSPGAGFEFRGAVTHLPEGGNTLGDGTHQVNRVLSIGSDLFTLSPVQVKASDLDTLAEKATLELPAAPTPSPSPIELYNQVGQPVTANRLTSARPF